MSFSSDLPDELRLFLITFANWMAILEMIAPMGFAIFALLCHSRESSSRGFRRGR